MDGFLRILSTALVLVVLLPAAFGQTRKRKSTTSSKKPNPAGAVALPSNQPVPEPSPGPAKRNERPDGMGSVDAPIKSPAPAKLPTYRYEFSQPEFTISFVRIEHDDAGVGTISFRKKGADEEISDPLKVSAKALARINEALDALNFISSTEDYQYQKDFSHLGNIKFSLNRDGRVREVTYNWTENKYAKALMAEYRKLGNQYVWMFDISLSRENQPLEAPKLLDTLESQIKRNEISDPHQLEPLLKELSNDERIPLIARNHAQRLVNQFAREKAKEEKKTAN